MVKVRVAALSGALILVSGMAAFAGPGNSQDDLLVPTKPDNPPSVSPSVAMIRLVAGNNRFLSQKSEHNFTFEARRMEVSKGQHPFAMILACSDSRVPPEIVFDQGLGDLFVVRNAGNGADLSALASMQYAIAHLGSRLLVVMGHEKCGAVSTAMAGEEAVKDEPEELRDLLKAVRPGIASVPAGANNDETLSKCVAANVRANVAKMMASPGFKSLAEKYGVQVIGAVYNLETGVVRILNDK